MTALTPLLRMLAAATLALLVACSAEDPPAGPDLAAAARALDSLAEAGGYSGVAVVADRDSVLLSAAYGLADEDSREPITLDTRFSLASMGKMFTAVAALRLREEGLLELDQTVGEFLPDYPLRAVRDSVTVRHLLTHTSGLGDYLDERMEAVDPADVQTLADYQALFATDSLRFAPGAEFSYSNAGYVVLGRIVEKLAGTSFTSHLRQTLFEPLGMSASGWVTGTDPNPGVATGYVFRDSTGRLGGQSLLEARGRLAGLRALPGRRGVLERPRPARLRPRPRGRGAGAPRYARRDDRHRRRSGVRLRAESARPQRAPRVRSQRRLPRGGGRGRHPPRRRLLRRHAV